MADTTFESLAATISTHASTLHTHLNTHSHPYPSFAPTSPSTFPVGPATAAPAVREARIALLQACQDLTDLVLGPEESVVWRVLNSKYDLAALRELTNFGAFTAVPLPPADKSSTPAEISLPALATATSLPLDVLTRLVRHSATSRVLQEHRAGFVSHTAASAALARSPELRDNVMHNLNDAGPAAGAIGDAVKRWGEGMGFGCEPVTTEEANGDPAGEGATDAAGESKTETEGTNGKAVAAVNPGRTPFNHALATPLDFWAFLAQPSHAPRRSAFHGCMRSLTASDGFAASRLVDCGVDWKGIGSGGVVVDIGGSHGHVSATLARAYPHLQFQVQDRAEVITAALASLDDKLPSNVTFLPHSFLDPQPTHGADVYLLRWILHDWADDDCVRILRGIVPALTKAGARVVVNEVVLPEAEATQLEPAENAEKVNGIAPADGSARPAPVVEKLMRSMDLQMLGVLGARERSQGEWAALVRRADERFKVVRVHRPAGGVLGVLEIALQ
ncbi:O-methyltransferase-domain-containing protein [Geopyxis carbonaria]|nr:O-methyltransferase-domain-containing protein [Geopyxis carbonaria]